MLHWKPCLYLQDLEEGEVAEGTSQTSKIEADPHSVESVDFQEFEAYHPCEEDHKTATSGTPQNSWLYHDY